MFRFTDAKTMSAAAGEAILFDFQDCDWDGVARPLASVNRSFVFTLYDNSGTVLLSQTGTNQSDATGEFARFISPGTFSDGLRSYSSLSFDLAERLDDGDDQLMTGSFNLGRAAPLTADNDGAPRARYIQRVRRRFDPIFHTADPIYDFTFASFAPVSIPVVNTSTSVLFSKATNSGLIALF